MEQPEGSDGRDVSLARGNGAEEGGGLGEESLEAFRRVARTLDSDRGVCGSSGTVPEGTTVSEWVLGLLRGKISVLVLSTFTVEKTANTAAEAYKGYKERMRVLVSALAKEFNHKNIKFPADKRMLVGGKDLPSSLEYNGGISGEFIRGNVVGIEADAWSELGKGVVTLTIKGTPVGALYLNIAVEDILLLELDESVAA